MAEVITSGKVIQKPELVLEVDDFLPPGLIGVRNKTLEEVGRDEGADSQSVLDAEGTLIVPGDDVPGDENDTGVNNGQYYDTLPIPLSMNVISQTIRVGEDKKMVVDVVIESPDFPGITEFEVRMVRDAPP